MRDQWFMTMDKKENQGLRQKRRNRALLIVLIGMVILFYVISVVRIGSGT